MPQQTSRVRLYYDSLSRVIEDSQEFGGNTRNATNEEFESYPVTQVAFPNGRQITNDYDDLYRRTLVEETSGGADIASWEGRKIPLDVSKGTPN